MIEGLYGLLGVIVAMVGVIMGLLVKLNKKIENIEALLESRKSEN